MTSHPSGTHVTPKGSSAAGRLPHFFEWYDFKQRRLRLTSSDLDNQSQLFSLFLFMAIEVVRIGLPITFFMVWLPILVPPWTVASMPPISWTSRTAQGLLLGLPDCSHHPKQLLLGHPPPQDHPTTGLPRLYSTFDQVAWSSLARYVVHLHSLPSTHRASHPTLHCLLGLFLPNCLTSHAIGDFDSPPFPHNGQDVRCDSLGSHPAHEFGSLLGNDFRQSLLHLGPKQSSASAMSLTTP